MMRARLRFWLAALDVAQALHLPLPAYLWIVARASNATDWGPPLAPAPGGEDPW
jgi:hypothetical protein